MNASGGRMVLLVVVVLLAWLAGCTASAQFRPATDEMGAFPGGLLPALPDAKGPSLVFNEEVLGKDHLDASPNAINVGDAVDLIAPQGGISWAIWEFSPGPRTLGSVEAVVTVEGSQQVFYGLSDYGAGSWEFEGPATGGRILALDDARHKSPDGHFYLAAISMDLTNALVHKLILTTDHAWQVVTLDSAGNVGTYSSLAVVAGNPAISYCESCLQIGDKARLKYISANDATGLDWDTPQVLNDSFDEYAYTSLVVVNGNPAICFYTYLDVIPLGGGAIWYLRSSDSAGAAWLPAVNLDNGYLMQDYVGQHSSMAIVGGTPAVSYCTAALRELVYRRAQDVNGENWGARQVVTGGGDYVQFSSLVYDDGVPNIVYYDCGGTKLMAAGSRPDFSGWNPPLPIDDSPGDVGAYARAELVGGEISAAYYSERPILGGQLKYARYDTQAEAWQSRVVTGAGTPGSHCSLAIIAGKPAISYYEADSGDLWYVQATDAQGDTWGTPELVDSLGNVGTYTSLAEVAGMAAISYYDEDQRDLKYAIRRGP